MKRIVKIGTAFLLMLLISASSLNAQEKKNEQRIKIVVADKSGSKVEIDTLIKGDVSADSIKLKNGEVIFLSKHGTSGTIKQGEKGQMYVTVTSDDKGEKGDKGDKKIRKEITVISGDSDNVHQIVEGGDLIIVKNGKHFSEGKDGKVVTWSSSGGSSKGESYVYINEDTGSGKDGEKTFNVKVVKDDEGNTVEKTKYIIAKDGMVISIEGNNETKVKDMVEVIESKLGVTKEDKNPKQVVKEETKKTVKK
jgi:hypothetical protein